VIPRPSSARRIDPPIGPDLADPSHRFTIQRAREAFSEQGDEPRFEHDPTLAASGAAVLIVLGAEDGPGPGKSEAASSSVVLIRRASHLRANPGEIAFPGGRIEEGESALAAALREAVEEVALPAGAVEVLGELPIVHAASRLIPVLPFVAVAKDTPALRACPDEVDCILVVPLRELVAPGRYWQEHWGDDPAWVMHFFDLGEDLIWGATARMLYELYLRLVSRGSAGRTDALPGERTPLASRTTRAAS